MFVTGAFGEGANQVSMFDLAGNEMGTTRRGTDVTLCM